MIDHFTLSVETGKCVMQLPGFALESFKLLTTLSPQALCAARLTLGCLLALQSGAIDADAARSILGNLPGEWALLPLPAMD